MDYASLYPSFILSHTPSPSLYLFIQSKHHSGPALSCPAARLHGSARLSCPVPLCRWLWAVCSYWPRKQRSRALPLRNCLKLNCLALWQNTFAESHCNLLPCFRLLGDSGSSCTGEKIRLCIFARAGLKHSAVLIFTRKFTFLFTASKNKLCFQVFVVYRCAFIQ